MMSRSAFVSCGLQDRSRSVERLSSHMAIGLHLKYTDGVGFQVSAESTRIVATGQLRIRNHREGVAAARAKSLHPAAHETDRDVTNRTPTSMRRLPAQRP